PHRVLIAILPGAICLVVAQLELFEEIAGRAALALANLPTSLFRLLVGGPARITAREGQGRHAERQHIYSAIEMTGRRVARHRRAARLVGVPWPAPWRRARFQCGDDPIGDFLIVVARHS